MKTRHLFLLMALLVAIMVGTFIWFVATWSPEDNPSLTDLARPPVHSDRIDGLT
ncbi:hypothetical protein JQU17_17280 [Ponticoccus sp. SC2-23]|uniref:hypothetical protein n=1 Tax=Alexandriicola marinus TaxID=2081710 RepID=UPI0013DF5937|nr:hypothetical protein [Alexandriicola marinus]MBM1222151.1 hypothetical protein [Ponticoccus sp. SC6-9]MBM1226838.1 hypothetical protein [Ponticoccus sp. SC6-15]MBM1231098.1 hypothetical protein [Ponticoccus sp. SC6-38]MBM1235650.1 hypothetical protein [Ponticoccus sp. SC6-45]MBM1240120.1 hypothetical protein [Ponticoccus sp. SC6-49]MBM1244474.1 hypothetical protein [Ponticoccus sp. SC2-64]MBM1249124.1 hypothetical protein [Ponticoccus sp. SC6-42]MBM1253775.1 hypothetical protein [Pontico